MGSPLRSPGSPTLSDDEPNEEFLEDLLNAEAPAEEEGMSCYNKHVAHARFLLLNRGWRGVVWGRL